MPAPPTSSPQELSRPAPGQSQANAFSLGRPQNPAPPAEQNKRPNIFLRIDSPQQDQPFAPDDEIDVTGWVAASEPVVGVIVEVGGASHKATTGIERPDLAQAYPGVPALAHAGFAAALRLSKSVLPNDQRVELKITATTVSGRSTSQIVSLIALAAQKLERGAHQLEINSTLSELPPAGADATLEQREIRMHLDVPAIANGKAMKEVTTGLSLSGWALAKGGIDRIDVFLDGAAVGKAYYGMRRSDVAQAFPDWEEALLSGFGFSLPRRLLRAGKHRITLEALSKTSARGTVEFEVQVVGAEDDGRPSLRTRLSEAERRLQVLLIDSFELQPWFEIGLQTHHRDTSGLLESIRSVAEGSYEYWSITVSCPSDCREGIKDAISEHFSERRKQIVVLSGHDADQPTKRPANSPLWHMRLAAGDRLSADALFEFAAAINANPTFDFVYGDDRRFTGEGTTRGTFFKPDWSPELLLSQNYIGRAFCASDALLRRCGLNLGDVEAYDLALSATEKASGVSHVRRVVFEHGSEVVSSRDQQALHKAIERRGLNLTVENGLTPGTHRLRPRPSRHELVSIIIPTCAAGGLIETCLTTLREKSSYPNIEIICIDNIREAQSPWKVRLRAHADIVVEIDEPFNWSRFNNLAAAEASGELLLFLNDDVEITQPDWLEVLVSIARRNDVGAVGPQLLYPDGKVQHAGLFLSQPGLARHAFRFLSADDPGYFGLALSQRNVIAVTGACLMVRKNIFEQLGGFEEAHAVINNDLDFCLRCHAAGLWNVYTPFASLVHHELASRAWLKDDHHGASFADRWENIFAQGDPFFHPDLDPDSDSCMPQAEPVNLAVAGGPSYRTQSIRKILAIKLDHIGDFVTAFPAFRRIKQKFPGATLCVLAAPASCQLAFLEPAIDEIIPFEFFHARSERGQQDLQEDELEALRRKLAPHGFDLAVDFRKHPETRMMLKLSGARLTAGYENQDRFPWLDVALQSEGDPAFVTKRQHISDDLVNLVDAIAAAGREPEALVRRDWSNRQLPLIGRLNQRDLYSRPVVCVHPAAGNELKQWPPGHFASLINLLVANEDVNVAIVGGPDEAILADEVVKNVRSRDRVVSLIGELKLDELALFIESCALFVGNDSGPKHIAAALGVPTIGVQSGIVDAKEWGPSGEIAVAITRDVSCAPCYLGTRQDCQRDLACLTGISPGIVFAACQRLLALRQGIRLPRTGIGKRSRWIYEPERNGAGIAT